ncbi:MAG: type VI secretion system tube protein Hcp [Verrucomicrobiota bacterium]
MSKHKASILVAVVSLILGCCTAAQAAVDMFLKVSTINGESRDYAHPAEIDVLAWTWGMSKVARTNVSVADLSLTKYVDASSPVLMSMCATGKRLSTATLTVRSTGDHPVGFYCITLTDVIVAAVSTGGSSGEDRLIESVTLNFASMSLIYTPVINALPRTGYTFSWSVPANSGVSGITGLPTPNPAAGLSSTLTYTNGSRTVSLKWASSVGTSYQVWVADSLDQPFLRYGSPMPSTGNGTTAIILPANAIKKFFRIETLTAQ